MRTTANGVRLLIMLAAGVGCHPRTVPQPGVGCRGNPAVVPVEGAHPSGRVTTRVSGFVGRPFGVGVSFGTVYVTQQDANSVARLQLHDLAAGSDVAVGADPGDVIFTRDGATAFVSNYNDGTVHVLDVTRGVRARVLAVAPGSAYRLALSPDDSRLYVTSINGRLYSVDPTGAAPTTSAYLGGPLQGIVLSRDGLDLTVSNAAGGLWRLNACTLQVIQSRARSGARGQALALTPDGDELYVADETGYLDVLDPSTLLPIRRVSLSGLRAFDVAVTPDAAQVYVTSPTTGQLGLLDRRTGALRILPVGGTPRRIAFDYTGRTVVITNEGNWVDVIR